MSNWGSTLLLHGSDMGNAISQNNAMVASTKQIAQTATSKMKTISRGVVPWGRGKLIKSARAAAELEICQLKVADF